MLLQRKMREIIASPNRIRTELQNDQVQFIACLTDWSVTSPTSAPHRIASPGGRPSVEPN